MIANKSFAFSGKTIDASRIDKALLESLHELGGVEANVATGYHAVEFLLWGQGPQRHRPGRRQPGGERLRPGQLLVGQLRPQGGPISRRRPT